MAQYCANDFYISYVVIQQTICFLFSGGYNLSVVEKTNQNRTVHDEIKLRLPFGSSVSFQHQLPAFIAKPSGQITQALSSVATPVTASPHNGAEATVRSQSLSGNGMMLPHAQALSIKFTTSNSMHTSLAMFSTNTGISPASEKAPSSIADVFKRGTALGSANRAEVEIVGTLPGGENKFSAEFVEDSFKASESDKFAAVSRNLLQAMSGAVVIAPTIMTQAGEFD